MAEKKDMQSAKISMKRIRISFPQIFEPKPFEEGGEPKFSCAYLLDKRKQRVLIKEVEKHMNALIKSVWGKRPTKLKNFIFADGDEMADDNEMYDGHRGYSVINASGRNRPLLMDADMVPVTKEDNPFYAGCYCNVTIHLYAFDNKYGKGVCASLRALQWIADGEALADAFVDPDTEFDDFEAAGGEDEDGEDVL